MRGPFVLSKSCVNMIVPPRMLGVFGLSNEKDSLSMIKRAERNACEEIKNYWPDFKYFWFELASSPRDAFAIECQLYHTKLEGKNGNLHPKTPPATGWHCPVCSQ
jgi:hypothetical protein